MASAMTATSQGQRYCGDFKALRKSCHIFKDPKKSYIGAGTRCAVFAQAAECFPSYAVGYCVVCGSQLSIPLKVFTALTLSPAERERYQLESPRCASWS